MVKHKRERLEELKDKHEPGSFIHPLVDERTIYVCSPQTLVTVKRGAFLWIHGALPHGGMPYKARVKGND
jgi:hypothetical protein